MPNVYDYIGSIEGCADSSCLIETPKGIATNGGCRCRKDNVKVQKVFQAYGLMVKEIERLNGEIDSDKNNQE
jgi:hypothetical protein